MFTVDCVERRLGRLGITAVEAARILRDRLQRGAISYFCTNLGVLHEQGIGMDPDPAEAARLYAMGCDGGHAVGLHTTWVYLHQNGIGMDPDPAEAARLYAMGCDGGDAGGCTNLGYLHDARHRHGPRPGRGRAALCHGLRRRQVGWLLEPCGDACGLDNIRIPTRPRQNGCMPAPALWGIWTAARKGSLSRPNECGAHRKIGAV